MNKRVKMMMCAFTALIVVTALSALGLALSLGGFNSVDGSYDKHCQIITGMPGSEDIEPDYSSGFAYVSSDDRYSHATNPDERGAIFRLNMNQDQPQAVKMTGTESIASFHPHGLSLYRDSERTLLFAINHQVPLDPSGGHSIYVFSIVGERLEMVEQFRDPGIRSPNDLVAVGPRQFYFTNDRKALKGGGMMAEILLGLNRSDLSYFDGNSVRQVAGGLAFANGIAASADGSEIYATASRDGSLRVYSRDTASGDLTLKSEIVAGNSPDNIVRDQQGKLWVADHYNGLKQFSNTSAANVLSPGRVYRIDPTLETLDILYEDDGSTFPAISVAVPLADRLLFGSISADGVSICDR